MHKNDYFWSQFILDFGLLLCPHLQYRNVWSHELNYIHQQKYFQLEVPGNKSYQMWICGLIY